MHDSHMTAIARAQLFQRHLSAADDFWSTVKIYNGVVDVINKEGARPT